MKKKALVVLSGGQDSTTCLFWAKQNYLEVHAVTFDYGQRHRLEIDAAITVAKMAKIADHEIIDVRNCLISTSPLTSNAKLEQYENFEQMDKVIGNRVELTFVPMRNMLFLTIAMNRAVALGQGTDVITGICQADNANYPDCTESFRSAFERAADRALQAATDAYNPFCRTVAPFIFKSKAEMVKIARTLPGCWHALAYSHTSYDGKYPPVDMNHSNVLRAQGFEEAGLPDPLVLRAVYEGRMDYPDTPNYDDDLILRNPFR
jgi:7-cyano-7-deazaguanine synthase